MSRTIKAIERHIASRPRPAVVQPSASSLIAEWQQRGPETLSGHALQKLRLVFAPAHSPALASLSRQSL
jgi:hypothetical protein